MSDRDQAALKSLSSPPSHEASFFFFKVPDTFTTAAYTAVSPRQHFTMLVLGGGGFTQWGSLGD